MCFTQFSPHHLVYIKYFLGTYHSQFVLWHSLFYQYTMSTCYSKQVNKNVVNIFFL